MFSPLKSLSRLYATLIHSPLPFSSTSQQSHAAIGGINPVVQAAASVPQQVPSPSVQTSQPMPYNVFKHSSPYKLQHSSLPSFELAYESWGKMNSRRDNVILLHTGLSASSHAKSHEGNRSPGWWEKFIGPGLPLDTNKFHIICTNVLGGCYGSTGPSSINPTTSTRFATQFPIITIFDMVRAQFKLLDYLNVDKLHASVGASMGGMQSLAAATMFPERVDRLVTISACARSHPYSIAVRHTQRQVLMSDPNWNNGFYYDGPLPTLGMKLAREIATITYRSGPEWEQRFGRKRISPNSPPSFGPDFSIEGYLDHQGDRFKTQYDPNSLLYISKAMDMFDMSHPIPSDPNGLDQPPQPHELDERTDHAHVDRLIQGLSPVKMPTLVLGVQSDILFPVWQQREIAECLRKGGNTNVTYYELDSLYGHDTFLLDMPGVGGALSGFLTRSN